MLKMKKEITREALKYHNVVTSVEMFVPASGMEQIADNLVLVKEPCGPFVHKNLGVICIITPDKTGKFGMVIKDQFFDQLPKFVQEFTLSHEIGHFENGHHLNGQKNKLPNFMRTFGVSNQMEFEADEYAARKIGRNKCIEALRWICENTDLPMATKWEMHHRISHLKKNHAR